ncbi:MULTISPECIES: phosphatidylglycerol lysyltransferase domain-containing protein [unclassified Streptomyces]|uniref:phosphatidylglycerol lysyltransferase domain-containing protein n=1 Tax=Streptomyces sp. HYC2 TaxID=2955207 RepID=UPI001CD3FA82|nr:MULTISPECIES: phosphatidylglycerol lysyltransferase domain-containing protein [unclassified Streptomyces]
MTTDEGSSRNRLRAVSYRRVPAVAGYLCLLVGVLDVAGAIFPRMRHGRVHTLAVALPGAVSTLATAASLIVGVLMVMLAHALRRRKRRAWRAVMILLPTGAALQLLRWHQHVPGAVTVLLFVLLLVARREFYALSDPRTRWRAVWNFLLLSAFSLGAGLLIVGAHPRKVVAASLSDRIQHVAYGLVGIEGPVHYSSERTSDLVYFSLAGLGLLTAATTLYLALRPSTPVPVLGDDEERRLRALLERHGERDSLGYFALRRDKNVLFSPTGKAAIAYRVVSGVMLAGGDPIGDVEAWPGAIKEFMDTAARHAWVPAVMGCSETGGEVWTREAGLNALEIGDEAVVDTGAFTLSGRPMRNVRQMVNRIERGGYSCRIRRVRDLSEQETEQIRAAAAAWRGTEVERGFSMALGRFGEAGDGDCVVVTAHKEPDAGAPAPGGDIRAVLHFVPWGRDGISLDLMRRDRTADPGLNELLIVKALQQAPGLGVGRVSLNFAMFRAALARGERLGAGPALRAWRGLLLFLSRWFQIESLYKFNAKFQPRWEPRFLVYPTARDLLRISLAALQAEAFLNLSWPAPWRRKPRRPEPAPVPAEVTPAGAEPAAFEPPGGPPGGPPVP